MPNGSPLGTELRMWLEQHLGLTLAIGLGMAAPNSPDWHGFFRLGHMAMGLLGGIDTGLKALGIPHGPGALDAAATALAAR
ncbi:hypothetical protein [Leisingera sp. NJS204]|uniref:hypothetical protein n=1 Tax=Leisingera sp. NJS204 TaxID=2508307 RepID=UPI0026D9350D